jgi:hypothetical protein
MRLHVNRMWAVMVLAAAAVPMLTACTPVTRGVTGMTLDAAGRPTVAVAWCPGKPPNTIIMYDPNDPTENYSATTVQFRGPKPPGTYVEIPLTALPPGWTADPPTFTIAPAHEYRAFAGVSGNDYTTYSVNFTLEQLRPQGAAKILAWVGTATPSGDQYKLLTVSEFKQLAHQHGMC